MKASIFGIQFQLIYMQTKITELNVLGERAIVKLIKIFFLIQLNKFYCLCFYKRLHFIIRLKFLT